MALQACFRANSALTQVSFDALQAVFASATALLQAVTFAALAAFIAMTEAEQAAPQAVAGAPGCARVKAAEAADPSQSATFAAPEFAKKLSKTREIAIILVKRRIQWYFKFLTDSEENFVVSLRCLKHFVVVYFDN